MAKVERYHQQAQNSIKFKTMTKTRKFLFTTPITTTQRGKFVHLSDLTISGTATEFSSISITDDEERYSFVIDAIIYEGTNVLPLVNSMLSFNSFLDEIETMVEQHVSGYLFNDEARKEEEASDYEPINFVS